MDASGVDFYYTGSRDPNSGSYVVEVQNIEGKQLRRTNFTKKYTNLQQRNQKCKLSQTANNRYSDTRRISSIRHDDYLLQKIALTCPPRQVPRDLSSLHCHHPPSTRHHRLETLAASSMLRHFQPLKASCSCPMKYVLSLAMFLVTMSISRPFLGVVATPRGIKSKWSMCQRHICTFYYHSCWRR